MSTPEQQRSECGGKLFQALDPNSYAWEFALEFDRTKLKGADGALELVKYVQQVTQKEPAWLLWTRFKEFLFTDKVQKDDTVTKLFMRRKKLARRAGESGCQLPELLEDFLYLEMLGLTEDALTMVFGSFSDMQTMSMARVLQKLRTMYSDKLVVDISKKKNTVAMGLLASGEGQEEEGDEEDYGYHGEEAEFEQDPEDIVLAYVGEHEIEEEDEAMEAEMSDDPEYQEANISFTAAKDHINNLRIARGYFLVVAVQDPKKTFPEKKPNTRQGKGPFRGKFNKGRGRGRGRRGGRAKAEAGDPKVRPGIQCFRCGGPHYSADCPKNDVKRSRGNADDMDTSNLVFTAVAEGSRYQSHPYKLPRSDLEEEDEYDQVARMSTCS